MKRIILILSAGISVATAHPNPSHSLGEINSHLADDPRNIALLLAKVDLLVKVQRLDLARQAAQEALRIRPGNPDPRCSLARLDALENNAEAAISRAEAVVLDHPHHAPSWKLLAKLYEQTSRHEQALAAKEKHLASATQTGPDDYVMAARLSQRLEDLPAALRWLEMGIGRLGCVTGLHYLAADLNLELGRNEAALSHIAAVEARYGPGIDTCQRRAIVLQAAGKFARAEIAWDGALALLLALPAGEQDSAIFQKRRNEFETARAKAAAMKQGFIPAE